MVVAKHMLQESCTAGPRRYCQAPSRTWTVRTLMRSADGHAGFKMDPRRRAAETAPTNHGRCEVPASSAGVVAELAQRIGDLATSARRLTSREESRRVMPSVEDMCSARPPVSGVGRGSSAPRRCARR
jgi:hypothetical protein